MLKRIERDQLCVGMYIEAFEGGSPSVPFADRRFLLEKPADLKAIRNSTLSSIIINTSRGSDIRGDGQKVKAPSRSKIDIAAVAKTVTQTTGMVRDVFGTLQAGKTISVEAVSPIVTQLTEAIEQNPSILLNLTRLKTQDEATFVHSLAVSALMIRFARYMNYKADMVGILGMSGLLHDVGKTAIPIDILTKPGSLASDEMDLMRSHPVIGHSILSRQDGIPEIVLDVCLNHHERPDGSGYPAGISGDKLSVYARMGAICDVYDAITSARPYKRPWSPKEAASWMLARSNLFDRELLPDFLKGAMKL